MRKIRKTERDDPQALLGVSTETPSSPPAVPPAASPGPAVERSVSAVSLNLAKVADADRVVRAISEVPRLRDTDVFLFQEVATRGSNGSIAQEVAQQLGYFAAFRAAPSARDQGLALVSRYPVADIRVRSLKASDLHFRSRSRFAMTAKLQTPWSELRVWNVHLDTRINAGERLDQIRPVIDEGSRHTGPQLIGGDFNTNELYWLKNMVPLPGGRRHGAAIRRMMTEHGFEAPFPGALNTFPMLRRHLDWIFVRDLIPLDAGVEFVPFSDHNALWARLRFRDRLRR